MNRYEFEIQIDTLEKDSNKVNDEVMVLLNGRDYYEIKESECEVFDYEDGCYVQKIEGTIIIANGVDPLVIKADIKSRIESHIESSFDYAWVWIGDAVIADDYYGD